MSYYDEKTTKKVVSAIESIINVLLPEDEVVELEAAKVIIRAAVGAGISSPVLDEAIKELYGE